MQLLSISQSLSNKPSDQLSLAHDSRSSRNVINVQLPCAIEPVVIWLDQRAEHDAHFCFRIWTQNMGMAIVDRSHSYVHFDSGCGCVELPPGTKIHRPIYPVSRVISSEMERGNETGLGARRYDGSFLAYSFSEWQSYQHSSSAGHFERGRADTSERDYLTDAGVC
jgi:hypothetical protein